MQELAGRTALITGGAKGIGRAIATLFARNGASVAIADLDGEAAARTAAALRSDGLMAHGLRCNVVDTGDLARTVEDAAAWKGGLDILVHNAGIFPQAALDTLDDEILEATVSINLTALFRVTRHALPHLKLSSGGRILVTSSIAGNRKGVPHLAHYGATKAGVNGFIRCAAVELGPFGINVNGVEPGLVRTERFALSDASAAAIAATIPAGRLGETSDIAEAMLFLASHRADWITGQTIVVDGGGSVRDPSNFIQHANS